MTGTNSDPLIKKHYGRADLSAFILSGLQALGKNLDALSINDLAPVDQFHTGGKEATRELARLAALGHEMRVLDVGGGLGGPARLLAKEYGCNVEVLDITEEYCHVGEALTKRMGLTDRVSFKHGSALDMPYENESFDVVWSQHSSMNIAAKERLYTEMRRVLRQRGRFAFHEIVVGQVSPIHFPVPWARDPSISFLCSASHLRALLNKIGLAEVIWTNQTAAALAGFKQRLTDAPAETPPFGLHLLLGDDFSQMSRNQMRNLEEGRVEVIQAVFERP